MLKVLIVISTIVYTTSQAIAFPGEARRYFKDWLVVCQKEDFASDDVGNCRANTSIRDKTQFPYGDGTIFQFTLARAAREDYHIEFYSTLKGTFPSDEVALQFDHAPAIILNTLIEGNLAALTIDQTKPLIESIKKAHWLTITYVSQQDKLISRRISLKGATASLLYINEFYAFRGY